MRETTFNFVGVDCRNFLNLRAERRAPFRNFRRATRRVKNKTRSELIIRIVGSDLVIGRERPVNQIRYIILLNERGADRRTAILGSEHAENSSLTEARKSGEIRVKP